MFRKGVIMKEATLQQQICEFLSIKGIFYFCPLNETAMMILNILSARSDKKAKIMNYLKKMGFVPGIPDIAILSNNTIHFFELKIENKDLTKSQNIIKNRLIDDGFNVAIIRSLTQAIEQLKQWKIIK